AEAGINNAVSVLANPSNDPTNASLLPARTDTYGGGTVTWSGTYDASTTSWKLTATSSLRNPTGPSALPVTRMVTAVVPITPNTALQFQGWNYIVATRTGNPCDMTLSNGVSTSASIYTFGNLCLGSSSHATAGALAVQGGLTVGSGASAG